MTKPLLFAVILCSVTLLVSCGGEDEEDDTTPFETDNSTARGTLIQNPPRRVATFEPNGLVNLLLSARRGQNISDAAGSLVCGVDFHRIEYQTVGALEEATATSGILLVPTGSAAICTGPRPIVGYAHGTSASRSYNLAAVSDPDNDAFLEALMIGAIFAAAQGYVVVAPNYVGYDQSALGYHPYLNADQQAKDMIDALTASRKALGKVAAANVSDNGQFYLTGYSQGGHVAMATHRAMQTAGQTVTASAPLSGPYALLAFLDRIMLGQVNLGSTQFMPLATASYQKVYGDLYNSTSEIYEDSFASGIETLLPSATSFDDLVSQGKLPEEALFSATTPVTGDAALDAALAKPSNATYARGFGAPNLVRNSVRVAYARDELASRDGANTQPQQAGTPIAANPRHPLRMAARRNDLRNWQPSTPMMLCGGNADPTVYWDINTLVMQSYWSRLPSSRLSVVDLDSSSTGASDIYADLKKLFAAAKEVLQRSGGSDSVTDNYHVTLTPFCIAAAREFFTRNR